MPESQYRNLYIDICLGAFAPQQAGGCASKTNQAHIGARWQWLGLFEESQWRNDERRSNGKCATAACRDNFLPWRFQGQAT